MNDGFGGNSQDASKFFSDQYAEVQSKTIDRYQKEVDELREKNEALHVLNQELTDKLQKNQALILMLREDVAELNGIITQYKIK